MKFSFTCLLVLLCCTALLAVIPEEDYKKEIEKWRADRVTRLTSDGGWLTVVGLFWLKEGENKFGSGTSNEIVFPAGKAPETAGSFRLDKKTVKISPSSGASITHQGKPVNEMVLKPDVSGDPTVLSLNDLTFFVIQRGEKFGIRLKDKNSKERKDFEGIEYFPIDSKWQVEARFEEYKPHKKIPILNILGMVEDQPSPGALVFQIGGKTYRLDSILEEGETQLFIMFADQTSGKETYGAGRYLYVNPPGPERTITLDFNKAYNPPCAFTNYATCPLPPRQNRLALRIEAGEKSYGHSKK